MNDQLHQRRRELGLTQDVAAKMAKISRVYYTNIEAGRKIPSMKVARQIADALKTNVNQIFFANDVPIRNCER